VTSASWSGAERMRKTASWRAAPVVANIPEAIGGLTMLAITLVLFAGVIWRYFFVDPLTWSDEISRLLFAWLAFVGAAVGVKRGSHSAVAFFEARMPPRWQRIMTLIALAAIAVMACVLLYAGAAGTVDNVGQRMPVTGLSRAWQYAAVPVSGALMLIYLVPLTRRVLRGELRMITREADGE
jgi:TRAP-type C4-dicarboxylate transport system permease small subunit